MGSDRKRFDLKGIRSRAEKSMAGHGLTSPTIIRDVYPGAVFIVKDDAIAFPEERVTSGSRTKHQTRRVIVCSDPTLCRTRAPKTLLVVPCTGSMNSPAAPWHFEIPSDEAAFTKERVVALPHLLQPILKSDLVSRVGLLRAETFANLLARVGQNVGIVPGLGALQPSELELNGDAPAGKFFPSQEPGDREGS